ncbi:MAG: hypothetical protein Q4E50_05490 [Tissierellia bacterium]|nr:hypothetical protein [Tissierellia bacterium]
MKVCKFCGVESPHSVTICPSCGANNFKNKCSNCGSIYDKGNFCPTCGVKTGATPKKCPVCSLEYYSPACPNCGYKANYVDTSNFYEVDRPDEKETEVLEKTSKKGQGKEQTKKLEKTPKKINPIIWILLWIFIFPLPITILLNRNKKMKKWIKVIILVFVWLIYLAFVSAKDNKEDQVESKQAVVLDYRV